MLSYALLPSGQAGGVSCCTSIRMISPGNKAVSSRVRTSSTECFPLRDIAFPTQVVILRLRLKRVRPREGEPEGLSRVRNIMADWVVPEHRTQPVCRGAELKIEMERSKIKHLTTKIENRISNIEDRTSNMGHRAPKPNAHRTSKCKDRISNI